MAAVPRKIPSSGAMAAAVKPIERRSFAVPLSSLVPSSAER